MENLASGFCSMCSHLKNTACWQSTLSKLLFGAVGRCFDKGRALHVKVAARSQHMLSIYQPSPQQGTSFTAL